MAQSQGLGERPHFTGQEEAIHETGALKQMGVIQPVTGTWATVLDG